MTTEGQPGTDVDASSQATRVMITVVAGLIPGFPEEAYTRRWSITAAQWEQLTGSPDPDGQPRASEALAELAGKAAGYATLLQLQPDRFNWVHTEWIWY